LSRRREVLYGYVCIHDFTKGGKKMSLIKNLFIAAAPFVLAACLSAHSQAVASPSTRSEENKWLEVQIYRLALDPRTNQPVVLLSDPMEERVMPIWIGQFEANALQSERMDLPAPRPQTHDLFAAVMEKAKLKVLRVEITHIKANTYYASMWIESGDSLIEVDSRPSDALVMALKFEAPMFIAKSLFMDKSLPLHKEEDEEEEEDGDLWYEDPGLPI